MKIPAAVEAMKPQLVQRAVCDYLAARLGFQTPPTPPKPVELFAFLAIPGTSAETPKVETTEAPSEQPPRKQKARR